MQVINLFFLNTFRQEISWNELIKDYKLNEETLNNCLKLNVDINNISMVN